MAVRPPDAGATAVRRAPFSDNPQVGARGQRTQQRILDAALQAFAEEGYHRASIDRIAKLSGCSRVSFYQYFASKEDVYRNLAGQLARQLIASTEAMEPVTSDADGWAAMRAWVARYAAIHARYAPVFHAYEVDEELAMVAGRTGREVVTRVHSRIVASTLPPRQLDPVIRLFLQFVSHALDVAGILGSVVPDGYPSEHVELALTDVVHRSLFGLQPDVNVHASSGLSMPTLEFSPATLALLQGDDPLAEPDVSQNRAYAALLASARDVFVRRGYHNTRVDDLVDAAGVSHGAFYRYFDNKGELARMLTVRAMRTIGATLGEVPDVFAQDGPAGRAALRRWLRRYNAAHAHEASMMRAWMDAVLQDPTLRADNAPALDWGRRTMARNLRGRGFGDADMDAVVMVALLGVFGTRERPAAEVEAAAHIIERGLLGRSEPT